MAFCKSGTQIMMWSIRVSTVALARLEETRHDLLAEHAQAVQLCVEIAATPADPEPGGATLGQLLDARDPVAPRAGPRPALHRAVGQAEIVHAPRIATGVQHMSVQLVAVHVVLNLGPH